MQLVPVILSGGAGTRLWPLSRAHYPKQFLALTGANSLLQDTLARLDGLTGTLSVAPPVVVCNEEHRFLVAEQLRQLDRPVGGIVLEPFGRNTAPALTLAALQLAQVEEAVILLMPADHVLTELRAFHEAVVAGSALARDGYIVTFGIVPTRPETGYGYIEKGERIVDADGEVHEIAAFAEKPDLEAARAYVESGRYFWNSGMFMLRASTWLDAIGRHRPDILEACRKSYEGGSHDRDFYRVATEAFAACPADSIDYAVMEKLTREKGAQRAAVLALQAGWSDIGAWSALWEAKDKDPAGNCLSGDVIARDTRDSLLVANSRLLAAVGVEDLVVVETADAVLVAHKDAVQDVKTVVAQLQNDGRDEHLHHRRVHRPWGAYECIDVGHRYQVKRITVNPGACLSLQMHHHRAEHWVVVKGTARVTRGDDIFLVTENQSTYIPLGVKHRLENPGRVPLEMIEVQSGVYLGEDDIERFEDVYGRSKD